MSSRSLSRSNPRRDPYPRVLLVCEGSVTEKEYFRDLRALGRIPVTFEFVTGMGPKALVDSAIEKKLQAESLSKRTKDSFDIYDSVWVIFDVDEHPHILDSKKRALKHGIRLAISNPCFELWVLLHFSDQRRCILRDKVQKLCRKYIKGYKKRLPCSELFPQLSAAIQRAQNLRDWHSTRMTDGENPSTDVDQLVQFIQDIRHG